MSEAVWVCVRDEVALLLDRGVLFSKVPGQLIDGAPGLSEDERAALWLFAWSYRPRARQDAGGEPGLVAR